MEDTVTRIQLALPLALACALSACGGGGSSPPPPLDTATRIAAAQQTATSNANCVAVSPFYYEIGDKSGAIASGSVGGNTYVASTQMNIASASKWLFGAYVAEVRAGVLTAGDTQATHMQSGYVSMTNACLPSMTVATCFNALSNNTYTAASLGKFHYDSGHFQKWGVDNGMAAMTGADVASEYQRVLGSDIPVTFNGPLLAGGAIMSAEGYAVFLRKILNGQLRIANLLGDQKTCTLPGVCATAEYSPIPVAWDYSIGHWVEDDTAGDGSFSSAGAFGFYPWIDSTKTYYGVLARMDSGGSGFASYECGGNIRKAFVTGVAQ
ncbi:MAG: hypothetical protein KKH12_00325 [Gammaproteobacteria bacterium]|nr:hypothetical protein [Gammaproteobacteria bacterium]MBU1480098.1 hypothetical protein [Gammaproteobacteria bacterium]